MIRFFAPLLFIAAAATVAATAPAGAQSRVPSTHDPNCVGLICDPIDPAHPAPPPPCQGLLCSLTPNSMAQPQSPAEAQAAARARAEAEAAAPPAAPMAPVHRHRKAKVRAARVVAPRTADPASTAAAPPAPQ